MEQVRPKPRMEGSERTGQAGTWEKGIPSRSQGGQCKGPGAGANPAREINPGRSLLLEQNESEGKEVRDGPKVAAS